MNMKFACDVMLGRLARWLRISGHGVQVVSANYEQMIPPKARLLEGRFTRCPSCGKILWPGSHVGRIRRRLESIFKRVR